MPIKPLHYVYIFLLLLAPSVGFAQGNIRISGTILQADKKTPIPGASIIKINTQRGVISDKNGHFRIEVAQQDTLLIRAVGFKPLLYLPKKLPVSELRVNIALQEDSVLLGEVQVTSRPSPEMIERALRNMKRTQTHQVKKPGYIPGLEPPSPAPAPAPTIGSPINFVYDQLSKEGKEKRKLQELQKQQQQQQQQQAQENYNRFFKDNTGYE